MHGTQTGTETQTETVPLSYSGDVSAPEVSPVVDHVAAASTRDGTGVDFPTARHYGRPLVEQTRIDEGAAGVADGWDRTALLVSGPEARSWLNGFISQKIDAALPGTSTDGLLLDAQGRVEQDFGVIIADRSGGDAGAGPVVLLDIATDRADGFEEFLGRMVFWAQVEITRPDLSRLSVLGGQDFPGPGLGGRSTPVSPLAEFWRTRTTSRIPVTDLWVPRSDHLRVWDALTASGAVPTGGTAVDAWRIRDRRPVLGVDTDDRLIPHEVPAFIGDPGREATHLADADAAPSRSSVHLNKGCYRGQETVSRVHNLGRPPRLLVLLQLDGSAGRLPTVGAPVTLGDRTVGKVGSTVQDADYGPVALALVKRTVVEAAAESRTGGPAATLRADGIDAAIDRDDLQVDTSERPGRAAVNRLRGR